MIKYALELKEGLYLKYNAFTGYNKEHYTNDLEKAKYWEKLGMIENYVSNCYHANKLKEFNYKIIKVKLHTIKFK